MIPLRYAGPFLILGGLIDLGSTPGIGILAVILGLVLSSLFLVPKKA